MCSAIASATAVLPEAVGPKTARTVMPQRARGRSNVVARGGQQAQIALRPAIAAVDFLEHAEHRLTGHRREEAPELLLALVVRLCDPGSGTDAQLSGSAEVGRDVVDRDLGQPQSSAAIKPARSTPAAQ